MKERKKRRNRFVATGPSEYYSGGLLYLELCDGQNDVLCAQTQKEKMDFTRRGDERYKEIIWRTGICKRDKNGKNSERLCSPNADNTEEEQIEKRERSEDDESRNGNHEKSGIWEGNIVCLIKLVCVKM